MLKGRINKAGAISFKEPVSKYKNVPVTIDGIKFDSTGECGRYSELKLMQAGGIIKDLEVHTKWRIIINEVPVCVYESDFDYWDIENDEYVVEDYKKKATRTHAFIIKKKLMWAVFGIKVIEVG